MRKYASHQQKDNKIPMMVPQNEINVFASHPFVQSQSAFISFDYGKLG